MRICAVTVDVHDDDDPAHLVAAHASLCERGFRPTYFVPTALLGDARMRAALRALDDGRGEIASHGHHHDAAEIGALAHGRGSLDFLQRSARAFEDFFGSSPRAFRSPRWCHLDARALDRLAELGYRVDSSATPQRLGLFSSVPSANPWLFAPRRPRFVRAGLLEVPTSTFLVPFGTLSLALFRKWGGLSFAAALGAEAALTAAPLVVQLHASDFVATGPSPRHRPRLRDLVGVPGHGWTARYWVLDRDRVRMHARVRAVLAFFRRAGLVPLTMSEVADRVTATARAAS